MGSLVSREELRRLEKAAREKNKSKLISWMQQYENYIINLLRKEYDEAYHDEVISSVQNALTAVAYTALYSEENYIDKENLGDYMSDLFATIDMYRTGEYKPSDYKQALKEAGVDIDDYDYDGPYKKFLNIADTDLVKYLMSKHRKIITICGSSKFKEEILQAYEDLTMQNYMVLFDGVFVHADNVDIVPEEKQQLDELHKEKILISDSIYIINKNGYIGSSTKSEIEFAKKHNKEIKYMEPIQE